MVFLLSNISFILCISLSVQVNKQFAIELIENVPPKKVTERVIACNGGHGALGHPRVYINLVRQLFIKNNRRSVNIT